MTEASGMHALTLRFRDGGWERAFRAGTARRALVQARVALAVAVANMAAVGTCFILLVRPEAGGVELGRLAWAAAVPAAVALLATFAPWYQRTRGLLLGAAVAGAGLLWAAMAVAVPTHLGATAATLGVMMALLFGFVFIGVGTVPASVAGALVAGAALATTAAAGLGPEQTLVYWLGIGSALAGSAGAGHIVERYARRDFLQQRLLDEERRRAERLLLNVLPPAIAERLKAGEEPIADAFPETTVLFADLVGHLPRSCALAQFDESARPRQVTH